MLKHLSKHNLIEQDNTSTNQLEQNGKCSSTWQTKHIAIRCFYVTDKVKDGTVEVTYEKTTDMPSNYLTKPLTDDLFEKHRAILLRLDSVTHDKSHSFYINYKNNCDNCDWWTFFYIQIPWHSFCLRSVLKEIHKINIIHELKWCVNHVITF